MFVVNNLICIFKIAFSLPLWSTTDTVKSVNLNLNSTLHNKWWRFAENHTGNDLSSAWLTGHNVLIVLKGGEKPNHKLSVHYLDDWVAENWVFSVLSKVWAHLGSFPLLCLLLRHLLAVLVHVIQKRVHFSLQGYSTSESESVFLYCPTNGEMCAPQQPKNTVLQKKTNNNSEKWYN